jgi:hypothetical protein
MMNLKETRILAAHHAKLWRRNEAVLSKNGYLLEEYATIV